MTGKENRKKLRRYLKNYRSWHAQAQEIERALKSGEVLEGLRGLLSETKDDFVGKCHNVQLILGYLTSDGLERRIMNMLYVEGKNMKQVARELNYSYGYCANVELNVIERLSSDATIMQLLK